ncbi:hypothetical protein V1Y59_06475 [Gordonia sp. PKS22-38]|uniref:PPE family protein n=1 Tax=Gordonia prachuapensis TaxID=3115651 RepID=A0ABU7MSC3_9ACTN|nr:hypothetical protein [Gordonia sp. PKS22-38]
MTGAVGGGNTNWFVAIQQILSRLESMGPESAAADAQALAQAISAAHQAASTLYRFGGDGLQGVAASSSEDAARQISSDIVSAAANAKPGVDALVSAQGVLAASQAQRGSLLQLQAELTDPFGDAYGAMMRAGLLMTQTYNGPMSSAGDGLGSAAMPSGTPGAGAGGSGGATAGGSGGGSTAAAKGSAGAAMDLGEYGAQSSKTPATPMADGAPSAPPAGPSTAGSGDTPLSLGETAASGGGGDGPDSLMRGGLGSPESTGGSTTPTGMMPGALASGAGGGARAVGGAGSSSGSGGSGGSGSSSGANPAALSRRLAAPMPMAPSPPAGTSAPTPVGAGPSRAGAAPVGAPHGGRGRGSNDTEHKAPHYLHTTENGSEIVGELPLVAPRVIGDWAPPLPAEPTPDSKAADGDKGDSPDKDLRL